MGIISFNPNMVCCSKSNHPDKYISFSQVKENQQRLASKNFADILDKNIKSSLGNKAYNDFQKVFTQSTKSLAVHL